MRSVPGSLIIILFIYLLAGSAPGVTTAAGRPEGAPGSAPTMPAQCKPGKTSTEALGWRLKPGKTVSVYYLKNHFNAGETEAFAEAINKWNQALKEMETDIVFVIRGERDSEDGNDTSVVIKRGTPRGQDRVGETRFHFMAGGVFRMTVTISPAVTERKALQSLMTHEIGHTLGLADCYECKRGTTAMAAFKDDNTGTNVFEPSVCDKFVVAAGYAGRVAGRVTGSTAVSMGLQTRIAQ